MLNAFERANRVDDALDVDRMQAVEDAHHLQLNSSEKKGMTKLGNREDLAAFYYRSKDAVFARKVYQLCHIAKADNSSRIEMTICNLWKMIRENDSFIFLEFSFSTQRWESVTPESLKDFPCIPFFPFSKNLHFGVAILRLAIYKVMKSEGLESLPQPKDYRTKELNGQHKSLMRPGTAAHLVVRYFVGAEKNSGSRKSQRQGYFKRKYIRRGAKRLRKYFYKYFYDKQILKILMTVDSYSYVSYQRYLLYLGLRDHVIRVYNERPNLLPLMDGINPRYWKRLDLFSRKVWVRAHRKRTIADFRSFSADASEPNRKMFTSFTSKAGWSWLTSQKVSVVKTWVATCRSPVLATALSSVGLQNYKIACIAYQHLMQGWRHVFDHEAYAGQIKWLYHAYLVHTANLWQNEGYKALLAWLRVNRNLLRNLFDWLVAEGFDQGYPTSKSTLKSLVARSDDWHDRVVKENLRAADERRARPWESLVAHLVIGGVAFTALVNGHELAKEGDEMNHCVGGDDYVRACLSGYYRVFQVQAQSGERATLGLTCQNNSWTIDQIQGPRNCRCSKEIEDAARQLTSEYQRRYTEITLTAK